MFSRGGVGGRGGYRKDRSRQRRCSVKVKKGVLKNFINFTGNFTGKHVYLSLFLIKLQIRCSLQHRCFLVKFVKYIGTPILKHISKWLTASKKLVAWNGLSWHENILPLVLHLFKFCSLSQTHHLSCVSWHSWKAVTYSHKYKEHEPSAAPNVHLILRIQYKYFYTPIPKMWNICPCATWDCLVVYTVCKFIATVSVVNLHWS